MRNLSEHIRKLVQIIAAEKPKALYHVEGIYISFMAPPPGPEITPETFETIDLDKANFQWGGARNQEASYRVFFSVTVGDEDPKYYIFDIGLTPEGKALPPGYVWESDITGKKGKKATDIFPGDVLREIPFLKAEGGPNLFPPNKNPDGTPIRVFYINRQDENVKRGTYTPEKFREAFRNYVVFDPRKSKPRSLKNPFGEVIMKAYPKKGQL